VKVRDWANVAMAFPLISESKSAPTSKEGLENHRKRRRPSNITKMNGGKGRLEIFWPNLATRRKKKKKKEDGTIKKRKVYTDDELFQATGGARFGMRAQGSQKGKWQRTEGEKVSEQEEVARGKVEWNGLTAPKVLLSTSNTTASTTSEEQPPPKTKKRKISDDDEEDQLAAEKIAKKERKRAKKERKEGKKAKKQAKVSKSSQD